MSRNQGMPEDVVVLFSAMLIYAARANSGTTPAMAFETARDFVTVAKQKVPDCFESDEDGG